MRKRLAKQKWREYDELCDEIGKLTQELNRLEREHKDTAKTNEQLERVLDRCFVFVRREFSHKQVKK